MDSCPVTMFLFFNFVQDGSLGSMECVAQGVAAAVAVFGQYAVLAVGLAVIYE